MLNLLYIMRYIGGLGVIAPMLLAVPVPQVQVIGAILAAGAEAATIWLERNK